MSIKVEVIEKEENIKYPAIKIRKDTGLIVLFSSLEEGTVLAPDKRENYQVGLHHTNWDYIVFEKLESKVILEND